MFYTTLKRLETAATHRQVCLRRLKFFRKERISPSAQDDFAVRYRDLNRPTQSKSSIRGDSYSHPQIFCPVSTRAQRYADAAYLKTGECQRAHLFGLLK
jgi:hypothetical protein